MSTTTKTIDPLWKDLSKATLVVVKEFHQKHPVLRCPKCTAIGTLTHTSNVTPTRAQIKPMFTCSACEAKLGFKGIVHAIYESYSQAQPASEVTPIPEVPNSTKIFSKIPPEVTIVTPTKKNNNPTKTTTNFGETATNFDASSPITTPATTTTQVIGQKRARCISDVASAPTTTPNYDDALRLDFQSLVTKISHAELEIMNLKAQQQQTAEKYAVLEQQKLDIEKKYTILQQQQQQQSSSSKDEDSEMTQADNSPSYSTITPTTTTTNSHGGTASSKWADIAGTPPKNKNSNTKKNKNSNTNKNNTNNTAPPINPTTSSHPPKKKVATPIQMAKALKSFSAPTTTHQGFTYLYYPCKSRISRKTQRQNLKSLDVNNSRVLDIHYPSRTVVALLVHNDYREEIVMTLKKHGVSNLPDFSPTHHTTISDPQFKDLTATEKSQLAIEKHNNRLVRALSFIKDHIAKAVARFFEEQFWISKEQLASFILTHNEKTQKTKSPKTSTPNQNTL